MIRRALVASIRRLPGDSSAVAMLEFAFSLPLFLALTLAMTAPRDKDPCWVRRMSC